MKTDLNERKGGSACLKNGKAVENALYFGWFSN
jgi:hypothetical protein